MSKSAQETALAEIQSALEDGNSYGALQLFHSRLIRLRRQSNGETAAEFCISCAEMMANQGDFAATGDVLKKFMSVAEEAPEADTGFVPVPLNVQSVLEVTEIVQDAEKALEILLSLSKFVDRSNSISEESRMQLKLAIARRFRDKKDFGKALEHLRKTDGIKLHADVLSQLCLEGYRSEEDLFVCREVLRTVLYASCERAEQLLQIWEAQEEHSSWNASPLRNLVELVIEVAKSEAGTPLRRRALELILHVYGPALKRDEALERVLLSIGEKHQIIEKKQERPSIASLLGSMLRA